MNNIINVETGETIIREATPEELEQDEIDREFFAERHAKLEADKAEAQAKKASALAKLAALGLDEDNLKALGLG